MLEGTDWRRVAMGAYIGMGKVEREAAIPELPGIYVWSFDFTQLLGRDVQTIDEGIRRFLVQEGRRSVNRDEATTIEWRATRRAMPAERRKTVATVIARERDLARQLATAATVFQRPLYVGITSNLRRRTDQHLTSGRDLGSRLSGIGLRSCCLWWLDLPTDVCITNGEPGGRQEDDFSFDDPERADRGVGGDFEGDSELESPIDETDDRVLTDLAKSIESLLIRTSQPYFNIATDS
jgi:hypothetical protein